MHVPYVLLAVVICALFSTAALAADATPQADFFVAPGGNDAWSGTKADADGASGGPFATVARAQQAVRDLIKREPQRQRPIAVLIRGGRYELPEPLTFTFADVGTKAAPVTYAAYHGEQPILSGGRRLTGWTVREDGRWTLKLPEVAQGKWRFSQLFVADQRRLRPRAAGGKYLHIRGGAARDESDPKRPLSRFVFAPGDIRADWRNLRDVEVLIFNNWSMSRFPIESVDAPRRLVTLRGKNWSDQFAPLGPGETYLVENVAQELNQPGEWYLDRSTGELTYFPMPGEDPQQTPVIAPRLDYLVEFAGEPNTPVRHITLQGLTFAHTNWNVPDEGYSFPQAEAALGAAIRARGADHIALKQCTVAHTGGYAIDFSERCSDNLIEDCEFYDLGAGGIKIGLMSAEEPRMTSRTTVRDNLIAHGGRMHPAAVGIWIGQSPHNTIEHNEIVDFYYSGISAGWTWGSGPSLAHHNTFAYNHIHQIGQGRLSDIGGIYTLSNSPGTVQRFNHIHDVSRVKYGGWGIYLDEGSSQILVENNLVHDTQDAGFNLHYGTDNTIRNNVFGFGRTALIGLGRPDKSGPLRFERNIVYSDQPQMTDQQPIDEQYRFDHNLYWTTSKQPLRFRDGNLEQWRAQKQDVRSVVADPLFVDPAKRGFALQPDSPALKLGFKPFDEEIRTSGRRTPTRTSAPPVPHTYAQWEPPTAIPIEEEFELGAVGKPPTGGAAYQNNDQESIRITDQTAASGRHSLKFTDGPAQPVFNPHFHYSPNISSGTWQNAFALRIEPGAQIMYEWRDWPSGQAYKIGPSLTIAGDGTLRAAGRELMRLPARQWVRFTVTCGTGDQAMGQYALIVQVPGQSQLRRFDNLPCDAKFKTLNWLGWCAMASHRAIFYVDDIRLMPK